jgi:formate/nitrite transporter FocA (FNT family)
MSDGPGDRRDAGDRRDVDADVDADVERAGDQHQVDPDPDDHTVEQAFERTLDEGRRRLERSGASLGATGLVGGIDVATGVLALLVVHDLTGSDAWAGLAFAVGFIALTLARSELFTENFLVPVIAVVARQNTVGQLVRLWAGTTVFNLVGGWIVTYLVVSGYPRMASGAVTAGKTYVDYGLAWRAFSLALLGGLVITLMTWMQHTTESMGAKLVAAVAAAFLLGAGKLNHAIVASLLMFCALHTGHAPFGYLAWAEAAGWAALGNMVGGIGLVTVLRLLQIPSRLARTREDAPR